MPAEVDDEELVSHRVEVEPEQSGTRVEPQDAPQPARLVVHGNAPGFARAEVVEIGDVEFADDPVDGDPLRVAQTTRADWVVG